MKLMKRAAAVFLAVIMALSMPLIALAEGEDVNFTLTVNNTKCYAGMDYDIIAKITDAAQDIATGNTKYKWTVSSTSGSVSLTSKNNYSAIKNENANTYTVTETASFTMPEAGARVTITAELGTRTQTAVIDSLQPIDSYDVEFINNKHAYYDTSNNTLYVDRVSKAGSTEEYLDFNIKNITPTVNDDAITVSTGGFPYNKTTIGERDENSYRLTLAKDVTSKGTLNFSVDSGKTPKSYALQTCIPFESYKLNVKNYNASSASQFSEVSSEDDINPTLTNITAGKAFTISISKGNSEGNDQMTYKLFTDEACTVPALDKYYTVVNNVCDLSIDTAGTYYLVCKNISKDNGQLERKLGRAIIKIIVNKAYPIQNLTLYKLDNDGNKTDTVLDKITLYTNASSDKSTYPLRSSLTIDPIDNTDTVTYQSTSASIAKVDAATGVITAVKKGTTTIWVKSADNPEALTSVEVEVKTGAKFVTGIFNSDNITDIPSGHVTTFIAATDPTTVDDAIHWSTSDPDVLEIDPNTGVATAKTVTEKTPVYVIAEADSGANNRFPFNVVPAVRAKSVDISVTSESATMTEESSGVYSDFNVTSLKPFIIKADVKSAQGEESNDKIIWVVSYDNGPGMSFDEAKTAKILNYTKQSDTSYSVTPLKPEPIAITCLATLDEAHTQSSDPYDTVTLRLKEVATEIKVVNDNTGSTLSSSSTVNIPIDGSVDITVKTSTIDNDKKADPPMYEITAGAEYVSVTSRPSDDGEGVTYTIRGLSYGQTITKIKFSSTSGSKSITPSFPVRNNIAYAEVQGIDSEVVYTGKDIKFTPVLKINGSTLDTANYSVSYSNNKNVGTASVTFTGKGSYVGSVKVVNFTITPLSLSDAEIETIKDKTITSTTTEFTPKPYVKVNGTKLTLDKDYTFTYNNNNRAGIATVNIIGQGNYTGTTKATFNIIDEVSRCTVSQPAMQTYNGKNITPGVVVKYYGRTLTKGKDYNITYSDNLNPGKASVKIEGIGFFKGSVTKNFVIRPKKEKIKSLKKAKKAFTVKWTAQTNISGYQVQYALNKKFKKGKKTVTTDSSTTVYNALKLKKKKKYFVRVRSYKEIDGVKVYGAWSPVKSVKTK